MQRVGFCFRIKSDRIDEYKAHHQAVWPEMLNALQRHGWHNYSLFIRADGLIFGYFEAAENFDASLAGMATEAINSRWQEFMKPFFDIESGLPDQNMMPLDLIFHLE